MKDAILRGEGLCKDFGQTTILNHVDISVDAGDFTVIMGASGAGKSTLLYALSGMDTLTDGKVFYKNEQISGLTEAKMASLRAREFGFVFQQTHLVSHLTLAENVAVAGYAAKKCTPAEVRQRAEELLNQMNVKDARSRMPSQVSGGEAQRAAIARAIINAPGLLFADEPTGALNKANTEEVLSLLTKLHAEGQSILMVTHDVKAAAHGSRLLYLEDGCIIGEMPLPPFRSEALKEREAQVNAWLNELNW